MALPLDGFNVCKGKNVTTLDLNSPVGESALAEFQIGSYKKAIRGVRGSLGILPRLISFPLIERKSEPYANHGIS